ncbi:PAS domain-containing protein [Geothrix sp. SG200]|uniref:hybrid sensor histidine kinase/response regulator n=1 Tax=Geothrix sp. SG200 TaxID=2922865 RepID=UPI002434FA69|nr:PAS domain-containing protein [Geothrix sp. SG200]
MPTPATRSLRFHLLLLVALAVGPSLVIILVTGPAQLTLGQSLAVLAVAAGAAVLVGWGMGQRLLLAPLRSLADHLDRVARGELGQSTGLAHPDHEIGRLAQAFEAMEATLLAREQARQAAEAALRASEEHYRIIFNEAPIGIFHFDTRAVLQECNQAFLDLVGADRRTLSSFSMAERVVHPGVRQAIQDALEGRLGETVGEYLSVTGQRRVVSRLLTYPIKDAEGRVVGGIGLTEDMTERNRAEVALRESERRLDLFFARSRDAYYIAMLDEPLAWEEGTDREAAVAAALDRQRLTRTNPALAEQLGVPEGNLAAWTFRDLYRGAPDQAESDTRELLAQGHLRRELLETWPGGEPRWIEWDCICFFDASHRILGHFGIRRDVTDRKRTEEVLRQGEQTLRNLFDAVNDALFVHDLETGAILEANARATEMYGYTPEEFRQIPVSTFSEDIPPYTQAEALAWIRRAASGTPQVFEWRGRHRSGRSFWVEVNMRRAQVSGQDRLLVAARDVEARKAAEAALRDAEARYQGLFENSPDAIFWIGVPEHGPFIVESLNPAQARTLGRPAQEIVGRPLEDWLPGPLADTISANYRRCLEAGRPITYEESADLGHGLRHFQTLLVPIRNAEGRIHRIVGISTDITERHQAEAQRRQLEAQIQQAQKLESLGVLAGGIAHDFNNLLTAILGNLNIAQASLDPASPAVPFLGSAEKAVLKASDLTKQMLAYSGKGRFVVSLHDLNLVVSEMTHLLRVSISKKASLRLDLPEGLPPLEADGTQLQQVIMNLVTNASDALGDEEGTISIRTGAAELEAAGIAATFPTQSLLPGPYVTLEVGDTGQGMSPEVMARIFDPFFTTKATGRGLGLSAMLGILKGHRAGLQVSSEVGRGSTFKAYFPASSGSPLAEPARNGQGEVRLEGTILLVDDEPAVLQTIGAALASMGLDIVTAEDGLAAVARLEAAPEAIDLVLMDLTMPRMDGRDAFEAMRRIRPDLRVILSSGYNEQESTRLLLGRGLAGFLQKPYTLDDLRAALQKALAS